MMIVETISRKIKGGVSRLWTTVASCALKLAVLVLVET
jgi:hypothetical protein